MSDKLDRILEHVTQLRVDTASIQKDVEKNTEDLSEHIRRTNILEKQMNTALLPIKFAKVSGAILASIGVLAGLLKTAGLF